MFQMYEDDEYGDVEFVEEGAEIIGLEEFDGEDEEREGEDNEIVPDNRSSDSSTSERVEGT